MANTRRAPARPKTGANGKGRADPVKIAALEAEVSEPLEAEVARAQAKFEAAQRESAIEFFGETYELAPKIGLMPLLDFAHESNQGGTTADDRAMAIMRDILVRCFMLKPPCRKCAVCLGTDPDPEACENRDEGDDPCGLCPACLGAPKNPDGCPQYDPGDWPRFHLAALDNAADADDLLGVISQVIEISTSRPTRRRSGSLPSAPNGSPNSKGLSSSRPEPQAAGLIPVEDLVR